MCPWSSQTKPEPEPCGTSVTRRDQGFTRVASVVMNATEGEACLNRAMVVFSTFIRSPRSVIGRGWPPAPPKNSDRKTGQEYSSSTTPSKIVSTLIRQPRRCMCLGGGGCVGWPVINPSRKKRQGGLL